MTRRKTAVLSAVALGALGLFMLASVANATHPRPKGATPLRVSMVPAFNQCTAPNRTHGPPLAFPSCNPPALSSTAVTVGTPDANGAAANSEGSVKLEVLVGVPGPPDDSDVLITSNATDIRCQAGTTSCGSANAADGADYTGGLQGNATIRITDHYNAIAAGGGHGPGHGRGHSLPDRRRVRGDGQHRHRRNVHGEHVGQRRGSRVPSRTASVRSSKSARSS